MGCREAKKKLNRLASGLLSADEEAGLHQHLRECARCAGLASAEQLLVHDIEQTRIGQAPHPVTINQIRELIAVRERNRRNTNPGVRIMQQVRDTVYSRPRLSLSLAGALVLLLASILLPVRTVQPVGYEVAFASPVSGLILNPANAQKMLAALEIDDARVETSETDNGVEYKIAPLKDSAQVRKLTALLDSLGGQRIRIATARANIKDRTIWQLLLGDGVNRTGISSQAVHVEEREGSIRINLKNKFQDDFVLWMPLGDQTDDSLRGLLLDRQGSKTNIQIVGERSGMLSSDDCGWHQFLNNSTLNTRTPDGQQVAFNLCDLDDVRKLEKMGYNFATMEWDAPGQVPIPGMGPRLNEIRPDPSTGKTIIEYMIPQAYEVQLQILDERGRLIRNLLRSEPCACIPPAGIRQIAWDGFDTDGSPVKPGKYVCRFTAGDYVESKSFDFSR